ncbi:MAG: elongation factor G [Brevinematales bacterium]|nr:elongation factor G [Brevinematales bacterium]
MGKIYEPKMIRNISISGAPNVGKTTLAESMLFSSGVIKEMGSVDRGNTVMDFDEEEISKKMSLRTSLAYTEWKGIKVNILDTPGIPDLVSDVRSAFRVTEGIVFVVSATEGITIDTEKDWHFADDYKIARLVFINKMDAEGAEFFTLADSLKAKFRKPVIPIQLPIGSGKDFKGIVDMVKMKAYYFEGSKITEAPIPPEMNDRVAQYKEILFDAVAETDDTLIEKYLNGEELSPDEVETGLKSCTMNNKVIPILCGSAINTLGIPTLLDTVISFLPSPLYIGEIIGESPDHPGEQIKRHPDMNEPFCGFIFKTRIDPFAGKISYCRIRSGVIKPGDEIINVNARTKEKVAHLFMVNGKQFKEAEKLEAGDIAVFTKIDSLHTGNTVSEPHKTLLLEEVRLPKSSYFVAIHSNDRKSEDKLSEVFAAVSEEDVTFKKEFNDITKEMVVSCIGETQARIIFDTIKHKHGLIFETRPPRVAYKEALSQKTEAQYKHKKQSGGHGQYGEVYLRVEPLARDEGFQFTEDVFGGAVPKNYFPAVERGAMEACETGPVAGYPLVDVKVTLFDGSYHDVDSSDMAFRIAASHAMKEAFLTAKPVILEPIARAKVFVNEDDIGAVMNDIGTRRGKVHGMEKISEDTTVISVEAPYSELLVYSPILNSITSGRGRFEMEISHYDFLPEYEYDKAKKQAEEMKAEEESKKV